MSNPVIIPPQNIARAELQKAIQIQRAFGQDSITSLIYQAGMPPPAAQKDFIDLGVSKMLGNIVMSNLEIQEDRYKGINGDVSFPNMAFDTVLFNVSGAKNIVETNIQGKNGSVYEYISMANYSVQIRGVLTAPQGVYPGKKTDYNGVNNINNLWAALEAPQALRVNSWYLNQFNIFRLVVMSYEFPQNEGQYSVQPFLIEAKSDMDFIVNLV
jgi:hypothetical protein